MSYFFAADAPRSPAATLTTRYGKLELLHELLLDLEQAVVLLARPLRPREHEHLDLVELVHAEDPARVLAGGAGLAPEAGRVAGVPQRQLVRFEDLAAAHRRERHLRRADEVELVALDPVDVHLVGREEAGAVHRFLAYEHRRQHRREAASDQPVEREPVERELEQRDVADAVRRTARRTPSPRARGRSSRRSRRARGGRASGSRRTAARPSGGSRPRPRR